VPKRRRAIDYLRTIGRQTGGSDGLRGELMAAMTAIREYERPLADRMAAGLAAIPGVRIWGITEPVRFHERAPTFALTINGVAPRKAAEDLAAEGIFAWDGDFYARALIERLGLFEAGGVLRLGIVHYTTADEVHRALDAIDRVASARRSPSSARGRARTASRSPEPQPPRRDRPAARV
jgi:selenocysteine lyase/cysteine desulfurase